MTCGKPTELKVEIGPICRNYKREGIYPLMELKGDLIMKTKNEKSVRLLLPGSPVLERQRDNFPDGSQSWLDHSLGLDREALRSQKGAIAAELFLQTRLFPRLEEHQPINEQTLVDLLVDFKRSRGDCEVEFEMAQLAARLLSRFQCHLLDEDYSLPKLGSSALKRELDLFVSLAGLDFQRIDQAVRERLHSG
jgi:hypothetical protein